MHHLSCVRLQCTDCANSTTGALCEACILPGHYFDKELALCVQCPDQGARMGLLVGLVVAIIALLGTCAKGVQFYCLSRTSAAI